MDVFILFPIHLFSIIDNLKDKEIYLIEDPRYFLDFKYHKLKLSFHRATMKSYYDFLKDNNLKVNYIEFNEVNDNFYKKLLIKIKNKNIETYEMGDNVLRKRLIKNIPNIKIIDSLNFLVNEKLLKDNINEFYNGKKFSNQNFYKWQRIRLNILVTKNNKPVGGKWSFDKENRKKMPNNTIVPQIPILINKKSNKYIEEANNYINNNFPNNYGSLENFIYPVNHKESKKWLKYFLIKKFKNFGMYEDAVSDKDPFLFHSVLTPMMNIGLLTDKEVIKETLKYQNKVPINSFEGFIRQIIGWRNYMYSTYLLKGDKLKKSNFFSHKNKLNFKTMWEGKTEIKPIDDIIYKIREYGYAHHIERLMYLGNYMLLCMIRPDDVYKIFMEWTIDAYEWVMVTNVYSMSQYADGGLLMTRPYFSSSNYILKMSNYKKGAWCNILNNLFYNFIRVHTKYLSKNYSTALYVKLWNNKSKKEQKEIKKEAMKYIKNS
jgi:deoxyribodipyrimidine photolyase-related protein